MKIVKMETHMLSQKVIANVTPEFARVYNIPEGHTSVGFFSADNDDIGYLAVDDASKKAYQADSRRNILWRNNMLLE